MNFLERRTIRKYKKTEIQKEKIQEILELALVSPSGKNSKPYEYVVVSDEKSLKSLSKAKNAGGAMIAEAPIAIVILGNKDKSDTWIEDCSIAATLIQYKAWELGLGSCWVQMRGRVDENNSNSENIIRNILNIPDNFGVLCVIPIGYPDEKKESYSCGDFDWSKIHHEKY